MKTKTSNHNKDYQKILANKLKELEKQKSNMMKVVKKPATDPTITRIFNSRTGEYDHVQSRMNYDLTKEQLKLREAQMAELKEQHDLMHCSFKPTLNKKSVSYVKNMSNYTPIYNRKPKIKNQNITPNKEEDNSNLHSTPTKPHKKPDPDFLKRQLEWESNKMEKLAQKRIQQEDTKEPEPVPVPKVNTKFNKKMLKNSPPFIERIEEYRKKSKTLQRELEEKYHSYTFRPTINENKTDMSINTRENTQENSLTYNIMINEPIIE